MPDQSNAVRKAFLNAAVEQLQEGYRKIRHCVGQLDETQIWWRPNPSMNAIGNLLLHLSGNIRQWLIAGLSSADDNRKRQMEFDARSDIPAESLMQQLEQTIAEASTVVSGLSEDEIVRVRRIQEFDVNAAQAIQDSVSHFRGHVQEIIHMTRLHLGGNYQFDFVPTEQPGSN